VSKELTVDGWVEELNHGLEYRQQYGIEKQWADLEALFYGVHGSSANDGPNIIMSTGDALLSALNVPVPYITVKPRGRDDVVSAKILESLDNELLVDTELRSSIELASLHAYLWGRGILKIGYDSEWGFTSGYDLGRKAPMGLTLTQFDKQGRRIEFDSRIRPGMPWVRPVLPHDIVVPFGTTSSKDAPWIAHRVVRHVDAIKADLKYEKKRDLEPVMSMEDYMQTYQSMVKPYRVGAEEVRGYSREAKSEFVELWEIHERHTQKVIVIATGHKKFLRNEEDLLQVNNSLPFVDVGFTPRARSFWTTSDAFYLRFHQAELSDIALQSGKQRRMSILKFLYAEDSMDESELEKVLGPDVGVAARVKNTAALRDTIMSLTPTNNNMLLQQDAEYIRRSAREAVGFSRNQLGEFESKGRRTATEAQAVQQGSNQRLGRRQAVIREAYIEAIKKINSVIFAHWSMPRWAEVMGEWVEYRGRDLRGDFRYDVGFSSERGESLEVRRASALQMYQILSQDPNVDQSALRTHLKGAFNDPEFDNILGGAGNNANVQVPMSGVSGNNGAV